MSDLDTMAELRSKMMASKLASEQENGSAEKAEGPYGSQEEAKAAEEASQEIEAEQAEHESAEGNSGEGNSREHNSMENSSGEDDSMEDDSMEYNSTEDNSMEYNSTEDKFTEDNSMGNKSTEDNSAKNNSMEHDSTEPDAAEEGIKEPDSTAKEGKFFKKKKKDDKLEKQLLEQIADLEDKLKRQMAEFDNFRKRTEREKSAMFEIGAKDIIERILPVVDNFERGLGAVPEEEREGAFAQGIEKIYKQLMTALEDAGVKPIEAVGQEFDPNFHNAVMHAEDEEQGENLVTEEFQKGYLYRDSVVRHSMVKVVN